MENALWIVNEAGESVPFRLTQSQETVWNAIEAQRRAGEPVRLVVLKSRQVRISSLTAADCFTQGWSKDNFYALVMAHDKEVTKNLFRTKYQYFHEMLDPDLKIPTKRSSQTELFWEPTKSVIHVTTAGTKQTARSRTIMYVHGSEAAFYSDLKTVKGTLEASVHRIPETTIIWESTAFGVGTDFHDLWKSSLAGESGYQALFLNWFDDPLHQYMKPATDKQLDLYVKLIFEKLPHWKDKQKQHRLTARQLIWYFENLMFRYDGDEIWLMQEYPCTPSEAFISSGHPVFPPMVTTQYRDKAWHGKLYDPTVKQWVMMDQLLEAPELNRIKDSYLEIWVPPQPDRYYLIAVDPSMGYLTSDFSSVFVFDLFTQNVVAELHGRIEPRALAEMLINLGNLYHGKADNALIVVERDGPGEMVIGDLKERYFNLYQWRKPDGFGLKWTNRIGWETSEQSRLEVLTTARRLYTKRIRDGEDFVPSAGLIDEISTFVYSNMLNQKPMAEKNCFDDRVMAWAIGLTVCFQELASNPNLVASYDISKNVPVIKESSYPSYKEMKKMKSSKAVPVYDEEKKGYVYEYPTDGDFSGPFVAESDELPPEDVQVLW